MQFSSKLEDALVLHVAFYNSKTLQYDRCKHYYILAVNIPDQLIYNVINILDIQCTWNYLINTSARKLYRFLLQYKKNIQYGHSIIC